jgi:ABC transporter
LYRREVGFVFQRFNLLPALTVLDNVLAPVLPLRVRFDRAERARGLIAGVGLSGREGPFPSRLSGGQQQRVAIARALINQPASVLVDEPTGNLDSTSGAEIMDLLLELKHGRHATQRVEAGRVPQIDVSETLAGDRPTVALPDDKNSAARPQPGNGVVAGEGARGRRSARMPRGDGVPVSTGLGAVRCASVLSRVLASGVQRSRAANSLLSCAFA